MLFTLALVFSAVCSVPSVAVFCSSLMSCFPGMFFHMYFLNHFQIVPFIPVTASVNVISELHIAMCLYFKMF